MDSSRDQRQRGLTGTLLDGRYRIGEPIAKGGMSTVYRGVDLRLDRQVAVKVMAHQYSDDPAFLTRFSREARLAAGLSHPGVVAVYDHGRDSDHVFLVMELVDGGTLRELIHQSGPLPVEVAVGITRQLLSALAAAHHAGLVHRDVKPENVLISAGGAVKVADFGLVRAVSSHTMATGDVILGTVAYLSPEQVETGAATPRSDVYAAGIVLWEMLAGEPPFTGENAISVAYQHVHSEVPLIGDHVAGIPEDLEALLADATQRDPELRPADAADFADRLAEVQAHSRIGSSPIPVPAGPARDPAGPRGTRVVREPLTDDAIVRARHDATTANVGLARAPRRRRWPRRLAWLLVLLLLGAGAAATGWWLADGRWSTAPRTQGLTQQAAESIIREAGLIPHVALAQDDATPVGKVARTVPAAGARMLRGAALNVVVSTGRATVPAIAAGTSDRVASELLTAAGVTIARRSGGYSATVVRGGVLGTDPAAGSPIHAGDTVTLLLSDGPEPVAIPPVAGKSVEDAQNKLIVAGFIVGEPETAFDADQPDGAVLGTKPEAGQALSPGSPVSLVINQGATVPDLRGRPIDQAITSLQADGWQVERGEPLFDADIDGGSVVHSEPAAGSRIDPAAKLVTVFPSTAITVPDVRGKSRTEAAEIIRAAGLDPRSGGWFDFGNTIQRQKPEAGTRLAPGTSVYLSSGW